MGSGNTALAYYTRKEPTLAMQLPIYANQIYTNDCCLWSHNTCTPAMCAFMADLTCSTLSGRLCFNQKRGDLILSSINRSERIAVQKQVKRLYISLAASTIPVLIRTDCLKRSQVGTSQQWSADNSVQVSYEKNIFPLWTFWKMYSTSITGS